MCCRSLCSEWFAWVFAVETGWLSRFSTFPSENVYVSKNCFKPLVEQIHFSAAVDNWSGCFPQFDSYCSFLMAVMSALYGKLSWFLSVHINIFSVFHIPPYIPGLSLSVRFQGKLFHIFLGLLFWIKFSILGFFDIKPRVLWEDTAERYQMKVFLSTIPIYWGWCELS